MAVLLTKSRFSAASLSFSAGMALFAIETAFGAWGFEAVSPESVGYRQSLVLLTKSFLPGTWLCFSLSYSRGNAAEFLRRWRLVIIAAFVLPVAIAAGFRSELIEVVRLSTDSDAWWVRFGPAAKVLNGLLLVASVLILTNLEKTLRAAVGTMQWRIKFLILGLGVVFGARIYTRSQALLYSGYDLAVTNIESGALLIGCLLIGVAYLRRGFADIDVYPSHAVLQSSVTVLLAGAYLFVVGVLAQAITLFGGADNFELQAFVVLVGIAALAVLLLSDRLRQKIRQFVSRHFQRPQHDFRKVWADFTRGMANRLNAPSLCNTAAELVSKTFKVLSVTIWRLDERNSRLIFGASTSQTERAAGEGEWDATMSGAILRGLQEHPEPFDLEKITGDWADQLKQVSPVQFRHGGNRMCVPLVASDRCQGVIVLADRVNGVPYTVEEIDLLKCIGDQIAAGLSNLRLTEELMAGKELEAFQTMSAFFVHDLKNAASSLSLMLQNLPVHFDDPAFREDALRGIGKTVARINQLIERLSVLRHSLELKPTDADLNQLVTEALTSLNGVAGVEIVKQLNPLPSIAVDPELLQSVVTNLLLNAHDAVGGQGTIRVATHQVDGRAVLSVSDSGCGMSPAFMKDSLFRPFQTTKKKGLGIGMFQSRMIVEAHRGTMQVESEPGKGTTFRVLLPLQPSAK